jgi:hypothetical protein
MISEESRIRKEADAIPDDAAVAAAAAASKAWTG